MARQRRLWCCRRLPRPQAVRCPRQSRQDAPASETRVAARRRSVLKYRTHPNLTSTKSQDVPAESVEIWFRRMSAWAAGRDQCIYSGGRRLVERTGHRQGHCLERSKPLIETLFSQKLGPWVCTKVCAFRILRASETQCTCGFRWAEAKSHPFRQFLLYVCSVGDGEQFQPQFREGARRINGYRLRLHHAFVQRALAVDREIVGIGTDRHPIGTWARWIRRTPDTDMLTKFPTSWGDAIFNRRGTSATRFSAGILALTARYKVAFPSMSEASSSPV